MTKNIPTEKPQFRISNEKKTTFFECMKNSFKNRNFKNKNVVFSLELLKNGFSAEKFKIGIFYHFLKKMWFLIKI